MHMAPGASAAPGDGQWNAGGSVQVRPLSGDLAQNISFAFMPSFSPDARSRQAGHGSHRPVEVKLACGRGGSPNRTYPICLADGARSRSASPRSGRRRGSGRSSGRVIGRHLGGGDVSADQIALLGHGDARETGQGVILDRACPQNPSAIVSKRTARAACACATPIFPSRSPVMLAVPVSSPSWMSWRREICCFSSCTLLIIGKI